jgi:hypothetical protein
MKYINKFSTNADYQAFTEGGGYVTPNICYVEETNGIIVKPEINENDEVVVINHGILRDSSSIYKTYKIYWEYPVKSDIDVILLIDVMGTSTTHSILTLTGNSVSSNSYTLGPGETIVGIYSISPTEDDIYVYEVIIE